MEEQFIEGSGTATAVQVAALAAGTLAPEAVQELYKQKKPKNGAKTRD